MQDTQKSTIQEYSSKKRYGQYPEYKEADITLIDEIPSEWEISKIKYMFDRVESGTTPSRSNKEYYGGEIGWVTIEDLNDGIVSDTEQNVTKKALDDNTGLEIYPEGSLLIAIYASVGKLGILDFPATTSQASCVLINPNNDVLTKYVFYTLLAHRNDLIKTSYGGVQDNISQGIVKNFNLYRPPVDHQKKIVDFLDSETEKIDELIDKKKELVRLLRQKRSALITNAVTRGLDSTKTLKKSGIPGLGKIPGEWNLAPLKYSSRNITVGIVSEPSQYYVDEGVPALRSLNINENEVVEKELVYISEESNNELKGSQLHSGDLVSVRSGDPGTTAVVPDEYDGANCIDLIIIREPDGYIPEFLSFLMNSEASTSQIEAGTEGAAQQHFNVGEVKELVFPKPDLDEQREILDWLSPRLEEIDKTEAKIEEGIERLKEYRTALITEAVTGQIDVRGEV